MGAAAGVVHRTFSPGSEWLYVKLYTGLSSADDLLLGELSVFVAAAREEGWIDRWFYIRFGDPSWHLRLRLHGDPDRLAGSVLPALRDALRPAFQDGRLWRMQVETYEREVERYGGPEKRSSYRKRCSRPTATPCSQS
jgi:thiopeptide-type bacteriocin biosynthesis protein